MALTHNPNGMSCSPKRQARLLRQEVLRQLLKDSYLKSTRGLKNGDFHRTPILGREECREMSGIYLNMPPANNAGNLALFKKIPFLAQFIPVQQGVCMAIPYRIPVLSL
jgi:hypothetical protein